MRRPVVARRAQRKASFLPEKQPIAICPLNGQHLSGSQIRDCYPVSCCCAVARCCVLLAVALLLPSVTGPLVLLAVDGTCQLVHTAVEEEEGEESRPKSMTGKKAPQKWSPCLLLLGSPEPDLLIATVWRVSTPSFPLPLDRQSANRGGKAKRSGCSPQRIARNSLEMSQTLEPWGKIPRLSSS